MDKIELLEQQVKKLDLTVAALALKLSKFNSPVISPATKNNNNKDGIPIDTVLCATVKEGEILLRANKNEYQVIKVGTTPIADGKLFNSLSAAAQAVSGITRKSGWIFWKDKASGNTVKEQYKG